MTLKGFIGLQVRDWISDDEHETLEGAKVRFKNIRLKPVSSKLAEAGPLQTRARWGICAGQGSNVRHRVSAHGPGLHDRIGRNLMDKATFVQIF